MARDTFYQCMVKNNENTEACKNEEKLYHSKCLTSWVSACPLMYVAVHTQLIFTWGINNVDRYMLTKVLICYAGETF